MCGAMLLVRDRVLLLALSEDSQRKPSGYLCSKRLAKGRIWSMDCGLNPIRMPPDDLLCEPSDVYDCIFRVEACLGRDHPVLTSMSPQLEPGSTAETGNKPGTPVEYSMAIQLVHERSGAVLCMDARALAVNQKFAMKIMLKNIDNSPDVGVTNEEWMDAWWTVSAPPNVHLKQVMHFDEVRLQSHRWQRYVRAIPTGVCPGVSTAGADRREARIASPENYTWEGGAAFEASLLRVIPYERYVPLPASIPPPSTAAATDVVPFEGSSADGAGGSVADLSDHRLAPAGGRRNRREGFRRKNGAPEDDVPDQEAGRSVAGPSHRQLSCERNILHGGDVVRLVHLSSTGFLACDHLHEGPIGMESEKLALVREASASQQQRQPSPETHKEEDRGQIESKADGEGFSDSAGDDVKADGEGFSDSAGDDVSGDAGSADHHEDSGCITGGGDEGNVGSVRRPFRHPSLLISGIPDLRRNHGDKNSNCLWQLERMGFTDGGRHLLRNSDVHGPGRAGELDDDYDELMETVRIRHVATMRYLCVLEAEECEKGGVDPLQCDNSPECTVCGGLSTGFSDPDHGDLSTPPYHVCMLHGDEKGVLQSSLFILRPRASMRFEGARGPNRAEPVTGDDVLHVQHHKTLLYLAAPPWRVVFEGDTSSPKTSSRAGSVCLGTVTSPMTNEYWRVIRAPDCEVMATSSLLAAVHELQVALKPLQRGSLVTRPGEILRPAVEAVEQIKMVLEWETEWLAQPESERDNSTASSKPNSRLERGEPDAIFGGERGVRRSRTFLDHVPVRSRLWFQRVLREQGVIIMLLTTLTKISNTRLFVEVVRSGYTPHVDDEDRRPAPQRPEENTLLGDLITKVMELSSFFARDNPQGQTTLKEFTNLFVEISGSGFGASKVLSTIHRAGPSYCDDNTKSLIDKVLNKISTSRHRSHAMKILTNMCRSDRLVVRDVQDYIAQKLLRPGSRDNGSSADGQRGKGLFSFKILNPSGRPGVGELQVTLHDFEGVRFVTSLRSKVVSANPSRINLARRSPPLVQRPPSYDAAEDPPLGRRLRMVRSISNSNTLSRATSAEGSGSGGSEAPPLLSALDVNSDAADAHRRSGTLRRVFDHGPSAPSLGVKSRPNGANVVRPHPSLVSSCEQTVQGERLLFTVVSVFCRQSSGQGSEPDLEPDAPGGDRTISKSASHDGTEDTGTEVFSPPESAPLKRHSSFREAGTTVWEDGKELLDYFVAIVRLMTSLCAERNEASIALVRSQPGLDYENVRCVIKCRTVPHAVRAAFLGLLECLFLDVAPILPQPMVRCVRLTSRRSGAGRSRNTTRSSSDGNASSGDYGDWKEMDEDPTPRSRAVAPANRDDLLAQRSTDRPEHDECRVQRRRLREALKFCESFLEEPEAGMDRLRRLKISDVSRKSSSEQSREERGSFFSTSREVLEGIEVTEGRKGLSVYLKPVRLSDNLLLLDAVVVVLRWCLVLLRRLPEKDGLDLDDRYRGLLKHLSSWVDAVVQEGSQNEGDEAENGMNPGSSSVDAGEEGLPSLVEFAEMYGESFNISSIHDLSQSTEIGRSTSAGSSISSHGTGMTSGRRVGPIITARSEESRADKTEIQISIVVAMMLLLGQDLDRRIDDFLEMENNRDVSEAQISEFLGLRAEPTHRPSSRREVQPCSRGSILPGDMRQRFITLANEGHRRGGSSGAQLTARSLSLLVYVTRYQKRQLQVISKLSKLPREVAALTHDFLVSQVSVLDGFSRRSGGTKHELQSVLTRVAKTMTDEDTSAREKKLVAMAVGLAPCLLRILRTLKLEEEDRSFQRTSGSTECIEKVVEILNTMVDGEHDSDLLRMLFSNLPLFLSFMVADRPSDHTARGNDQDEAHVLLSEKVAKLVESVIDKDVDLATSIPERDLARLARGAMTSRRCGLLTALQKLVSRRGRPVHSMQKRVLVALLRELSKIDFHSVFGWNAEEAGHRSGSAGISGERGTAHAATSGVGFMSALLRTIWQNEGYARQHALQVLEVIIACCKDKNIFTEIQCRAMVPVKSLISFLEQDTHVAGFMTFPRGTPANRAENRHTCARLLHVLFFDVSDRVESLGGDPTIQRLLKSFQQITNHAVPRSDRPDEASVDFCVRGIYPCLKSLFKAKGELPIGIRDMVDGLERSLLYIQLHQDRKRFTLRNPWAPEATHMRNGVLQDGTDRKEILSEVIEAPEEDIQNSFTAAFSQRESSGSSLSAIGVGAEDNSYSCGEKELLQRMAEKLMKSDEPKELRSLVADLQEPGNEEFIRALIDFICSSFMRSPPGRSRMEQMTMTDEGTFILSPSANGIREIGIKISCLSILRKVIAYHGTGEGHEGSMALSKDESRRRQQRRMADQGGGTTILLFVHGHFSPTSRTASMVFRLAEEMLKGGQKEVQNHFLDVLQDSPAKELFFKSVVNFIDASISRLPDPPRRQRSMRAPIGVSVERTFRILSWVSALPAEDSQWQRWLNDEDDSENDDGDKNSKKSERRDAEDNSRPGRREQEGDELFSLRSLMEFLRLLCEHHNPTMQNYMREQPENLHSFNVVAEVLKLLQELQMAALDGNAVGSGMFDTIYQVMRTLTEFVQGNEENRELMVNATLCNCINRILNIAFTVTRTEKLKGVKFVEDAYRNKECDVSPGEFIHQTFVLLYSLIEGCKKSEIFSVLIQTLDVDVIIAVLDAAYEVNGTPDNNDAMGPERTPTRDRLFGRTSESKLARKTEEQDAKRKAAREDDANSAALFLRALLDGGKGAEPTYCEPLEKGVQFFLKEREDKIRSIEIMRHRSPERMYFVVPDWCDKHWNNVRVLSMRSTMKLVVTKNVGSPNSKLEDFSRLGEDMLKQMKHLNELEGKFFHNLVSCRLSVWSVSVTTVNLGILVMDDNVPQSWRYKVGWIGGLLHAVVSFIRLVGYANNGLEKWLARSWLWHQKKTNSRLVLSVIRDFLLWMPIRDKSYYLYDMDFGPRDIQEGQVKETQVPAPGKPHGAGETRAYRSSKASSDGRGGRRGAKDARQTAQDTDTDKLTLEVHRADRFTKFAVMVSHSLWDLLYVVLSVAGLAFALSSRYRDRDVCYAFCLLDVSVRYKATTRVLSAVWSNWKTLLQTALLVVLVLVVFAAIGTATFRRDFAVGEEGLVRGESDTDFGGCDNLGECVITFFQYVLRSDVGSFLYVVSDQESFEYRAERFFFDVAYWVIVPLLLLNMVTGIILDSFAQQRDEAKAYENELRTRCVICGVTRDDFHRAGGSFHDHVTKEHNMWNYIRVRAYLDDKRELEYTSQESYVRDLQRTKGERSVSYFPTKPTHTLHKERGGCDRYS